jgi:2-keto-3-deoxy-L-rhamnonate aldolase RhmA
VLAKPAAEFVLLDMEHSGAGIDTIKTQIAFARGAGIVPMVRVPACLHHLIAPVLDAGAMGIMAPLVENARAGAVLGRTRAATRPLGRRGLAFRHGARRLQCRRRAREMDAANDAIVTIALIESARGIENARRYWPRRDSTSRGSGTTTCPTASSASSVRRTALRRRGEAPACGLAGAAKIPLGWLVGTGEAARVAVARGYRCICIGHEVMVFRNALAREFADARKGDRTAPRVALVRHHKTTRRREHEQKRLIGAAMSGAAGLARAAAVVPSAHAQTPAGTAGVGTLDRIIKDKKIRVTAEVTSPPFGILDRSNQPDGSEIATARQLAKDLGVELELVQVTAPQRIPALLAGRADVAISSLSITFDRAKTVMFAPPHGALSIVIAGAKK